ncbi:MAG: ribonuclease III [Candidatus Binatus sp.]|uniref:ribonuclease III n=1 Tax=Candidatus Binatus sp. TaxID=2811406 RepID=UPI0027212DA1|nr:ribonuclease III [Candidatus Binatus sp.]MDO8434838.1 ribonuclease III [Candidatus Binatus sp.]
MKAPNWLRRLFGRAEQPRRPAEPPENPRIKLERAVGYTFGRADLLETALTHPSAAVGTDTHYERLEFLGDAVLDLAIADLLMRKFPTAKEGLLSKQRASIVNARTLALKAQSIELNRIMKLGKGEEKSGGREKTSILAAAFEAVIGAIYTDGGLAPAQHTIEHLFADDIGGPAAERDYKTELQETAYRSFRMQPVYELIATEGPDHAKRFTTRIKIAGRDLGVGEGGSKKQSEQAAARLALERIMQERVESK